MKAKNFLVFFIVLLVVSTLFFTLTISDVISTQNTYVSEYNFENNTSKQYILPNPIFYNIYTTDTGSPSSTVVGNSVYSLVNTVVANSSVVSILKVTFNQQFSKILNETITPTLLPPFNTSYEGLILFNNSFITLQRPYFINTRKSSFFIRFTADSIISNFTVPFDNSYNNMIATAEYDFYFPIQTFGNNLFTLRAISTQTSPTDFILSKYTLSDLNLVTSTLLSSSPQNLSSSIYYPFNQSSIRDFFIDKQGYLWLGLLQSSFGGTSKFHYVKLDLNSLELHGSLLNNPPSSDTSFYNVNITIQPKSLGYQYKTVTIGSTWNWFLAVSSNKFIETITSYLPYYDGYSFTGLQITTFTQTPLPIPSFILTGGSTLLCVVGIIISYTRLKKEKIASKVIQMY